MKNKNAPYNLIKDFTDLKDMIYKNSVEFASENIVSFERDGERKDITFKKLRDDIDALGTYFYLQGLGGGKKVALVGENSYEWIITYFAAVMGGNVIVPLDKELGDEELANLIKSGDCEGIVYSKKKETLFSALGDYEIKKLCTEDFEAALNEGSEAIESGNDTFISKPINIDECCAIIFTSGTTGTPKGVMLSQRNLICDAKHSLETLKFPRGTVNILPLNHTFGFMANIVTQFWVGYPVYINNSLKKIMHDISEAKPGHLSIVPLFLEKFYKNIWKTAEKQGKAKQLKKAIAVSNALRKVGIDMRKTIFKQVLSAFGGNLEMLICGGAPLDEKLVNGFDDFGITVINGYGITECSPIVAITRECWIKLGSVGLPIPTVHVKIENPDENGEGEILVKGDIVMMGYYKNPEMTAETMENGWFKTGDIGSVDEDGFVYVTGRKKNLILLDNGKNVYPEELEAVIGRIENVDEVIVYDENSLITAEIYTENPDAKEQIKKDIQKFNKSIAGYKQIRKIKFRSVEFEKTTTKKIKRNYKG